MTDKYQKYKKIINKPQELLRQGFNAVKDWSPDNNWLQLVRVPAATVAFNLYLAMWLFTRIGFENPIIERIDKRNENKKINNSPTNIFSRVVNKIKRHKRNSPTASAFISYYFLLLSLIGVGKVSYDNKDNIKGAVKEWLTDLDIDKAQHNTFAEYQEKLGAVTPWMIAELIAAEGVHMNDQGLHTPYKDGKGIWTIGFGSTRLKDGKRVTGNTPPITTEEAYELARWHLEEHETFFDLYCYSVADPKLTVRNTGEAFGLISVVYNSGTKFIEEESDRNHRERFALLRQEYDKYGAAIPDSVVAELFEKYPIQKKAAFGRAWIDSHKPQDMADAIGLYMADGAGMHWRRWLEAGLITGDINPKDLLECPIKGMYDFYIYMGGGSGKNQKGKFALWKNTATGLTPDKSTYTEFKQWLLNPMQLDVSTGKLIPITRKKVKDYLPDDILQECLNGRCEIGVVQHKTKHEEQIQKETYVIGYDDYYATAINAYKQGDYESAIKILESLSSDNPDNALLHNDLALMYNKIGEYDKAIRHAQIILHEIGDKSQYGAAQYNAGVAYENQGNLEKALKNYKLALANGNNAARDAIKRVNKKLKSQKTIAFNDGIMKIKNKQGNHINSVVHQYDGEYQA